ncbi:hypothetical protein CDAR_318161 [Caerostris darwini]|uniref:Uncharacterized protein n=1 Tax=Caerostris darwini TaxID=1538125 RepID=A0AAV4TAU4_9ARAC|nr:hypothetical protein CDAR_318161 [Caerostris darwini]
MSYSFNFAGKENTNHEINTRDYFPNHLSMKEKEFDILFTGLEWFKRLNNFLTYEQCQLKTSEKSPRQVSVLRKSLAFEVINIDRIGLIEPSAAIKHRYVLCLIRVDRHSRWTEAIHLKDLIPKLKR